MENSMLSTNKRQKKMSLDKAKFSFMRIMILLMFMMFAGYGIADAERVRIVEPDNYPEVGNLNRAIEDDDVGDGTRAHDVYVLRRGGVYWMEARVNHDFHLHIRAEEGDGAPPIIRPAVDLTGSSSRLFHSSGDLTLEGVYLSHLDETGSLQSNFTRILQDGVRVVIDNCWLEFDSQAYVSQRAADASIFITNTMGRNVGRNDASGNGRIVDIRGNNLDTLVIENSTFYNIMYSPFRGAGGYSRYVRINHNTFMDAGHDWSMAFVHDFIFTNNQFANLGFRGAALSEENSIGATIGVFGLFSFDDIPDLSNEDRTIMIANNNFQFPWNELRLTPPIPYYDDPEDHSPLFGPFDPLIQSVFDDNEGRINVPFFDSTTYVLYRAGYIEMVDNIAERDADLQWVNRPDLERVANYHRYLTESESLDDIPVLMDNMPTEDWTATGLDYWRDLTYSRDALSFTSGSNGYPIGNLNYFPDLKARWEAGEVITSSDHFAEIPVQSRLVGNYPNPFNPTTNLVFELASDQNVSFEVFNALGQKVKGISDRSYNAGRHDVSIDGSRLASGIYLVRMHADGNVFTHKMTLIK